MVEQFHIGQRVRLTRTLATRPEELFRRGATGTVVYMEEMVLIRMDQHFPQLDHLDNATWVKGLSQDKRIVRKESGDG